MKWNIFIIQPTINITQNIPKVETEAVGVNTQTQDHKHMQTTPINLSTKYTNTNLASNRFVQTQPMQYAEARTNTNLPSTRFSQTQQRNVNTQSTNTPSQNNISTHNDSCKCEGDEINLKYKSDFARQLQQSEAIPNVQPVTYYNSEGPRQTESSTIYHIPQQSIQHI